MRSALVWLVLVAALSAGCHSSTSPSTTTSTTTTTTTTTVASPTTTETFSGVLNAGATVVFPFTVDVYGTVNGTLLDIGGGNVPSTVQVRLALGAPDGAGGCTASIVTLVRPASTTQVTATDTPGAYCVSVSDVGNLAGPASFDVSVAHP